MTGGTESLTDPLRETLAVFDGSGVPHTTTEVSERLELGRRSTYSRLERLVDRGELETKKVGASARVWWRPRAMGDRTEVDGERKRKRRIERHREQLVALNNLNGIVQDVTEAIIERSTREEIERILCERLAAAESYEFAWVGDVDVGSQTVNVRAEAGTDDYLEEVTISTDPDDEHGEGPTGRALRTGTLQTTQDIQNDPRYEPWRDVAERYGFRSSAAIPIVHEETVYGVLNVYADRPRAFEGDEGAVISQLGEIVGHAIVAAERKQALMADEVVELEFRIHDVYEALAVGTADGADRSDGFVALEHTLPIEDEEYLVYGTAATESTERLRGLVAELPHWTDVTFRAEDDGTVPFELRLSEPPVLSAVASVGGSVERAVFEDGDFRMTLHLSPSVEVRTVIDAVQSTYPTAEMVARRQITRDENEPERTRRAVTTELTDRQRTVLEAAYHAGLFEWPRSATGEEVADSLEIAAPTFHQHLRKAQGKVFDALL
ncbi:HTH DNA binding domain-containing protein [Halobiforma haloterrestris]|uniref:HTH DNA binding domain-containing protein n=1 Tax=Natronobacterium haloterrestre TaxID=148448 RepID=A0A1I1EEM2_NATHA|nr:bacterio-opsin activator domain-containing protein [Halobiforma haloterrestris]SFB85575.1 HTH DNA binding domain-containing protein [Halobiforma haloterrestris]